MTKRIPRYALLIIAAIVMSFPFLWLISTSFKGSEDIFSFPPQLIPTQFTFQNFIGVLRAVPFATYLINSLIVSIITVGANILLAALAAYPLARMEFKGKTVIFILILSTMMIPEQVILIPLYVLILKFGMVNTFAGLILPFSVRGLGVFMMRQAYKNIPVELEEAAVIDGYSTFQIWRKIAFPLVKPTTAALAIFMFIASWSNFLWPLIVLQDQQKYTLSVGLAYLTGTFSAHYRYLAAGSVIAVIPVVIVYLFMQRQFIAGILSGAVKQ